MNRSSGVLLSVTSIPSRYGIGCFSAEAYQFVDWLAESGQTYWQLLPLGPTSYGKSGDSPYQSYSAFAGNPYMICLETLIEEGLLTREECDETELETTSGSVDYTKLHENRYTLLRKAYSRANVGEDAEYQQFIRENSWWLDDVALFLALKGFFDDRPWTEWPEDIRLRWGYSVDYYNRELYFDVEFQKYLQFKFFQQWWKLRSYANSKHIRIIGDMPIYVSMDSADVWSHPELFQLNEKNEATAIAGCPPDGFSPTGQIWGNPLYRWGYHKETGFAWWSSRLWHSYRMYDTVRIDHFRGFDEYYSIPANSTSALDGHWEKGPGIDLFRTLEYLLGWHPLIAEDLGYMTDTVRQLVSNTGFPNMKVLEFAFDIDDIGAANDYLPHNYGENCVAYTGTHDNETIVGWYQGLSETAKRYVRDYLQDEDIPDEKINWPLIALVMRSKARISVIPVQDLLGYDNSCRMNQPATVGENWRWRLKGGELTPELSQKLLRLTRIFARYNWELD